MKKFLTNILTAICLTYGIAHALPFLDLPAFLRWQKDITSRIDEVFDNLVPPEEKKFWKNWPMTPMSVTLVTKLVRAGFPQRNLQVIGQSNLDARLSVNHIKGMAKGSTSPLRNILRPIKATPNRVTLKNPNIWFLGR